MPAIYSIYIINKSGGLIYNRVRLDIEMLRIEVTYDDEKFS